MSAVLAIFAFAMTVALCGAVAFSWLATRKDDIVIQRGKPRL